MRIEQFDPQADSQRLGQCYEIFASCLPHDDPRGAPMGPDAFQAWWATGFGVTPRQTWIATDDSGAVGCYLLELPHRENTWMSWCMPVVPLDARRHGIGTELLTHCAAQAREAGRTHLSGEIREGTAGYAFATAAGVSYGLTEIRRDLELDAELAARLPRLRAAAEPAAAGYELLRWIGATPEEHLDQVAQVNEAMADAPRDEGREAEHWDADRVREADQGKLSNRLEQFTIAARHAASGEMAALTQVIYDPETAGWGFQGLTAVTGPHRGHRLGMLLKVAMLEWLPELGRDIQRVQTWNSESNEHMVGINVQLGFQISARFRNWELPVADYLDRARSRPAAASKGR